MDNNGVVKKYTKEQLKAAYALNLCTVSVSQIIEYNDVNIMEQEYETILNNLKSQYVQVHKKRPNSLLLTMEIHYFSSID